MELVIGNCAISIDTTRRISRLPVEYRPVIAEPTGFPNCMASAQPAVVVGKDLWVFCNNQGPAACPRNVQIQLK
jgi:hypothetical protein